jgi:hypothetical protein
MFITSDGGISITIIKKRMYIEALEKCTSIEKVLVVKKNKHSDNDEKGRYLVITH